MTGDADPTAVLVTVAAVAVASTVAVVPAVAAVTPVPAAGPGVDGGLDRGGTGQEGANHTDGQDGKNGSNVPAPEPWFARDDDSGSKSPVTVLLDPPVLTMLVVAGTAAVVVLERRTGDGNDEEAEPPPEVGRAAGRAADALDGGAVDADALHDARVRLAEVLGIPDPEGASDERVGQAAREAGMDPGDADGLADQFEVLRHGGALTAKRQAAAVDVLRAIQREYGDRGDDADDEPADPGRGEATGVGGDDNAEG